LIELAKETVEISRFLARTEMWMQARLSDEQRGRIVPDGRIEIGYWVREGRLGRGIATASARALSSAAFTRPELRKSISHRDEANAASAAAPNRLWFHLVQIVEDEVDAPAEVGRSIEWVMSRNNSPRQIITHFDS
jgi:RimJ/RimL family protein N-acetyltransferase